MNILFVCTANVCRSAMAEGILKKLLSESKDNYTTVTSAGIEALVDCNPDRKTVEICREKDIEINSHKARQVTKEMLLEADLVLCMQKVHQNRIISAYPQFIQITFLLKEYHCDNPPKDLEIKDPTGKSKKYYRECFSEIEKEIIRVLPEFLRLPYTPNSRMK